MDEEERLRQRLNQEIESFSINKLTQLGNQAISLGLIIGHGYHGGKYEILRQGQVLLMSPEKAQTYLENLIKEIGH
ncbi:MULTISPECIES: hypothetical protein [unclassified Coleofasciculus]|uniref:hypothetical protein n=1 Tax=unclassified Coleofasciculus TaxID=2692782 RepID=UPI00187FE7B6|nr:MULTISPECIES: hypothetical protein [unclassified Coleofasciculus]MBE9126988.1 hypothetical protein [Coleofasciculus sp. LEGE 07081]MBE9150329.1 hypothetical protein [Coleofasciculus sp. LEGE 07092]